MTADTSGRTMRVFHGTTTYRGAGLASGHTRNGYGLWVTDTAERAQLYADAQASGSVSTEPRYCASSLVVELEVSPVSFVYREPGHPSLDLVETQVQDWQVVTATARMTKYDLEHSYIAHHQKTADALLAAFGPKLHLIILD